MDTQQFKVDVVGQTTTGLAGGDIVFPTGPRELETHHVEIAPGGAVGRHRHPGPCWMYVLEGTIVAQSDDGARRTFVAGETFIEDAWEWVDNVNPASAPARFLAVVVGDVGESKVLFE